MNRKSLTPVIETVIGFAVFLLLAVGSVDDEETKEESKPKSPRPSWQKPPPEQESFSQRVKEFQEKYRQAGLKKNYLREKEAYDAYRAFVNQSRTISGWIGEVKKVNTSPYGETWVKVSFDGINYYLWPKNNDLLLVYRELDYGDWVRFSGTMKISPKITGATAVYEPCMKVNATSVQRTNR